MVQHPKPPHGLIEVEMNYRVNFMVVNLSSARVMLGVTESF
jgi:hypothetical protein